MYADTKKKCVKTSCGREFWLTAEEQQVCHDQKLALPDHCPACRSASASGDLSTAIATFEQVRDQGLGDLLPDPAALFEDVLKLMRDSAAPIHVRRRTFSEWLRGLDLEAQQIEKKLRAGGAADQLLRQRLDLIRRMQEVTRMRYEAAEAESVQRQKVLQAHLNEIELQEEIARHKALADERIRTAQLEETQKQARLIGDVSPTPPTKPVDPVKQAIDAHRKQFKAKATAKQLVISDFLKELQKVFRSNVEDVEKAVRIRVVLEAYKQEADALPKVMREFLEEVEQGEGVSRE